MSSYGFNNTFPITHPVVDVAIFNSDNTRILVGRKEYEKKFRFVGGFVDVNDDSIEQTVKREAMEETNLEIGNLQYICSKKVDDWRYWGDKDRSLMTHFYRANKISGDEKPGDDIVELLWIDLNKINNDMLVSEHKILLKILKELI